VIGLYVYEGYVIGGLASFIVIILNMVLTLVLRSVVSMERMKSKTKETISLTMKLFIAEYINTALITVIIAGDVIIRLVLPFENHFEFRFIR
jgi:hypothetical protein